MLSLGACFQMGLSNAGLPTSWAAGTKRQVAYPSPPATGSNTEQSTEQIPTGAGSIPNESGTITKSTTRRAAR